VCRAGATAFKWSPLAFPLWRLVCHIRSLPSAPAPWSG
jgi:hypothetical protein